MFKNYTKEEVKEIMLKEIDKNKDDLFEHNRVTWKEYKNAQFDDENMFLIFNRNARLEVYENKEGNLELFVVVRDNEDEEFELYFGWTYKKEKPEQKIESDKVKIPKEVAEAIEYVWEEMKNPNVIKHLALTN